MLQALSIYFPTDQRCPKATSSWVLGCSQQLRSMHCTKHTCCCYHLLLLLLCCCIAMCCCVPTCSHALLTAAPAHLLAARPKIFRRDLQTGQYLWGGGYSSSYLACGAVGVRHSPAENADATAPPPGHSGPRLLGGAGRSSHGGAPGMAPSLRRAKFFRPGASSAGTSPEMGQDKTEVCLAIAPQSSEQTEKA